MNNFVSDSCRKYPDILIGFATVPPLAGKAAIQELERSVLELGLKGIKLAPIIQKFYIYDEKYSIPILERATDFDIPVLVHCDEGIDPSATYSHPGTFIYGKITEKIPKLKMIVAHLGGGMFLYKESGNPIAREALSKLYLDTSVYPAPLVETAVKFMGAERIVMGSDFPLSTSQNAIEIIRSLKISDKEKQKILGQNAKEILKI